MKLKYRVIERFRGKYSVTDMCEVFEVSRSGYYAWRKRETGEDKDARLVEMIRLCQKHCGQTYGCRRVRMWLEKNYGERINLKKVLRLMRKYDLLARIRRSKGYTYFEKAVHKYPNLLKRQFDQREPNRVWVTDITYIPTEKGMMYMCVVMDLCGKMVLACRIGTDMASSLVTDTVRDAINKNMVADGLSLHSDQGGQYTSQAYYDLSQEYHISLSMSSPGCPYDNAAMENFFGTFKCECLNRVTIPDRAALERLTQEYVHFYNYERINMKNGLTPFEIRSKAA